MTSTTPTSKSFWTAVIVTGLLAGTLDITAAIIQFMIPEPRNPIRIFEYIASGVFGTSAFSGGPIMAVAGLVFHYIIATTWTFIFFVVYPKMTWVGQNKVAAGLIYGLLVWSAMNLVVLPLSNVPHFPVRFPQAFIAMGILMVAIGLPISYRANSYYSSK